MLRRVPLQMQHQDRSDKISTGQSLITATEADFSNLFSGIRAKNEHRILLLIEKPMANFKSVDDLKNVSGIGAKTLRKLKDMSQWI